MNPFDQKPTKSLEDMMLDWKDLSPRPYKKLETDPYTKARIILMEAEQAISEMASEVGKTYDGNENALAIRRMHLLYESVKGSGGTVVIPSAYSEGFSDAALKNMADSLKTPK